MALPWESWFARYQALARNLAAGILGGADEADDVVQEAMLALFAAERAQPGRFASAEHARNYLLRTVRNRALKRRERAGAAESLGEREPAAPHDAGDAEELRRRLARIERVFERLDSAERALFEIRFRRRLTLEQIAAETGTPVSTLHSREKALLARLRRAVERDERESGREEADEP